MNVSTALIRGNGTFDVMVFDACGDSFRVFAKQTAGECRTGRLSVYIKANAEKAQRIGFSQDTCTVEELAQYVREELLA